MFNDVFMDSIFRTLQGEDNDCAFKGITNTYGEDGLLFKFYVPDIEAKDIKVQTEDNYLTVTVKKNEKETTRIVSLAPYENADVKKIVPTASEVKLALGVLSVKFPYSQKEEERKKEYEITVA